MEAHTQHPQDEGAKSQASRHTWKSLRIQGEWEQEGRRRGEEKKEKEGRGRGGDREEEPPVFPNTLMVFFHYDKSESKVKCSKQTVNTQTLSKNSKI
jgi:hypothetical protein